MTNFCKILERSQDLKLEILDKFEAFIFDLDGVLWTVETPKEKAAELLDLLKKLNKQIFFATNNSLHRPHEYSQKIKRLGLGDFPPESVFCSSNAVALYLQQINFQGKAYLIGPPALKEEVSFIEGIEILDANMHNEKIEMLDMALADIDTSISAVIMGFDPFLNYYKLCYASAILNKNPDAIFVYTNGDKTFPTSKWILPGTGSFVACVQSATNREGVSAGKPNDIILKEIKRRFPLLTDDKICMIGDNILTDILFGRKNNIATVLVESGVHTRKDVNRPECVEIKPNFIIPSVASFFD